MKRARDIHGGSGRPFAGQQRVQVGADPSSAGAAATATAPGAPVALYLAEGLLAVHKPLTWTSQDVVGRIRGLLTQDAFDRGYVDERARRKKPLVKVGHGGTLDPLASGVLVLGVGRGTSLLQSYLEGDKRYVAVGELGYQTDTLDAEGKVVRTAPWDHVPDLAAVAAVAPAFTGTIRQVPPLYSAIRVGGKRLYEVARGDPATTAEDVEIPTREVEVYDLQVAAQLEDDVVRSGVVDGPRYREAAQAMVAAAKAAAAEAPATAPAVVVEAASPAAVVAADAPAAVVEAAVAETASPAAVVAVVVAADAAADAPAAAQSDGQDDKKRRRRDKRRQKKNQSKNKGNSFQKSLFDEKTVPALPPDGGALALPRFALAVRCGGGTYMRSLVRDVGCELGTAATMTGLVRTKQGPFVLADAVRLEDWTADAIYAALGRSRERGIGEA